MTPLQVHLKSIEACIGARLWAHNRDATRAWNEATRADWLIWWRLREHPDEWRDMMRVIVPLIREHTVPLLARKQDRNLCERALDAATRYVDDPSRDNQLAVMAASKAADDGFYACVASGYVDLAVASNVLTAAACVAFTAAAATAAVVAGCYPDPNAHGPIYEAADSAAYYTSFDEHGAFRERWCAAIRRRWPSPPWVERE